MKKKDESWNSFETEAQSEARRRTLSHKSSMLSAFFLSKVQRFLLAILPKTELPQYSSKEFWPFLALLFNLCLIYAVCSSVVVFCKEIFFDYMMA